MISAFVAIVLSCLLTADAFGLVSSNSFSNRVHLSSPAVNKEIHSEFCRSTTLCRASKPQDAEIVTSSYRKDLTRTFGMVAAAAGFSALIAVFKNPTSAIEFCSGYVLELCLSVDNLFVFLVLFDYFNVKKQEQEIVLKYGIIGAVILRGLFIFAGSAALHQFHQVLLLFAVVLFYSSFKIIFKVEDDDEEEDLSENAVVKLSKRFIKTTDSFDGSKFFTQVDGVAMATPLLLCLICVELSDVVFAFDSVPAIFGVTEDPFIVYSSNLFAIAGLRSLYNVLSQAVEQLQYLEKAVGIVLGFIATKMTFQTFNIELFNAVESLAVVIGILGIGVGASLWANKTEE